jgi:kynurenine/2-aminoadipate aminotransferase
VLMQKLLEHWGAQGLDEHARSVAKFYCNRRDVLLSAADRHLNGLAEWVVPEAGMFLWIKLLHGITDTKALIEDKAAKANVLFVPGQSFCPLDQKSPYVRASFSTASDEEFDVAMERLALLIKNDSADSASQKEGLL